MSKEFFDLYNFDRSPSGKVIERGKPVPDGLFRLVVVVFVFNSKGQMLIQQRQKFKKNWANLWDFSSSGHVQAGETSQAGAMRELKEEIGIEYNLNGSAPFLTTTFSHGFNDYYLIHLDADAESLKLQEEEVQGVKWACKDEIFEMIDNDVFIPYNKGLIDFVFFQSEHEGTHTRPDWTKQEN